MWAKWSGTHQVSGQWWSETALRIVIDANGNTLSDPSGKSYSWDFENRLTQAVVPGTGTVAFKYDPFGRRIYKSSPNFTGIFVYDGDDLIETVNPSGTVVSSYTRGQKIDEPLAELRSGGASFYEADGLGSVTSLSSSAGAVANTYTYDSFGNLTNFTGTLRNPFQYAGREFDSETGIYDYRHRHYDQNVGRFISEDPIGFRGGSNFYRYVANNPANHTDPMGLQTSNGTAYYNCVQSCLFETLSYNTCQLKKKLKWVAISGPIIGTGVCGLIVASEPYLAPVFIPCAGLATVSTWGVGGVMSIGSWNIGNMSSTVGCTTFCALNTW